MDLVELEMVHKTATETIGRNGTTVHMRRHWTGWYSLDIYHWDLQNQESDEKADCETVALQIMQCKN